MLAGPLLFLLLFTNPGLMSEGGWKFGLIWLNNIHHMTIERALTPRVEKRFRVLDAETQAPLPGARVVVVHDFDWADGWVFTGTAGPDGVARIRIARDYVHLMHAHVLADDYLMRDWVYFTDELRPPGAGRLTDDPIEVCVYRGPDARMGIRFPNGFRGKVLYRLGETKYGFQYPPTFPAGRRIWWSDSEPADRVTIIEQPPRIGGSGWNGNPVTAASVGGQEIPVPAPGEQVDGVAVWHIGHDSKPAPGGEVLIVGTRDDAIAQARSLWQRRLRRESCGVYNGWVRIVSPETKLVTPDQPYASTDPIGAK